MRSGGNLRSGAVVFDCESRSFLPERTFAARRTCAMYNSETRRYWRISYTQVAAGREVPLGKRDLLELLCG